MAINISSNLRDTWKTPVITTYHKTPQQKAQESRQSEIDQSTFDAYKKSLQGPGKDVLSGMESLVGRYNRAYGQAKTENAERYQQMLDTVNQTTGQRAADIRSDYAGQSANAMQRLAGLGMANTTVAPTLQAGFQREQQASLDRLADQMQGTKLGVLDKMKPAYPDLGSLQSTLGGVANQYAGGSGISSLLQALSGISY